MKQLFAVIGMNVRSIPQRAGMSIATITSVAFMVAVLLGCLATSHAAIAQTAAKPATQPPAPVVTPAPDVTPTPTAPRWPAGRVQCPATPG